MNSWELMVVAYHRVAQSDPGGTLLDSGFRQRTVWRVDVTWYNRIMVILKPFVCTNNAQNTVVQLAQSQWGMRGYLLVVMDRRGVWHYLGQGIEAPGRSLWYNDRAQALRELAWRRGLVEGFPPDAVLSGMVDLAERLVVALEPV